MTSRMQSYKRNLLFKKSKLELDVLALHFLKKNIAMQ